MNEFFVEILGYIGSFLVSICFIPQTVKVLTTKNFENVSIATYSINLVASILFLIYSVYFLLIPVLVCNISIFINCLIIVGCAILYD